MNRNSVISVFAVLLLVVTNPLLAGEPTGGVVCDLMFFRDSINDTLRYHAYSCAGPTLVSNPVYAGTRSMKFFTGAPYAGFQVFWAGNTISYDWWGPDTSVFWAHSNSVLRLWVRSTKANHVIGVNAYGFNLFHGGVGAATIARTNTWQKIELPIPASLLNLPLKGFEINFGDAQPTVYIDEFVVTNVRMYAGSGPPPPLSMPYIAASQVGYAPNMPKQFTSPVDFDSFTVVRVSDGAVVLNGGASIRSVASILIGNSVAYIGDFSGLTTTGRYTIHANGKTSLPFNIGVDVFDAPTRAAQRFFYYQRAFTAIEMPYAEGPWVHPTDAEKAPAVGMKGWHDAGDLAIYMPTMTQTIWWMLESWMDFMPNSDATNIPESGNGIPDILDEARWGLEWVRSQQDANGGFWANSCAGGTNSYPYASTTPNTVGNYVKTVAPTTQNTAKAIAILAYASKVYQPFDAPFAAACLSAARAGWAWMSANPNATNDADGGNCGVYAQGNDAALLATNKMWASAAMLYATGESQFETAFQSNYSPVSWISSYSKSDAFAGKMYLRCTTGANALTQEALKQSFFQFADGVRTDAATGPFQWASYYYWGSHSNAAHRTGQFSWQAYRMDTTRTADRAALLDNVHYMFGRNLLNLSYMSGSNTFGATQSRQEGFHHWMKALHATPFHFPGAVGGGPNEAPPSNDISYPNNQPYPTYGYFGDPRYPRDATTPIDGRFTDNDSWSTNEIAINWQGAILYNLLAAQAVARNTTIPLPTADTSKPVITSEQATGISTSGATITWTTNEVSSSTVEYGLTTSYGNTASSQENTLNHSVSLSGLLANTTYQYRVKSVDPAGNWRFSTNHSFVTGGTSTYAPNGATILQGSIGSGTYANLATNNNSSYVVNSTTSGTRTMDWYATFTIAETPSAAVKMTVNYDGKYSRTQTTQVLYVYDWLTLTWARIDSQIVGTSDITITKILSLPGNFISVSKQIRVRVKGTGSNNRSCSADFMQLILETSGTSLSRLRNEDDALAPTTYVLHQNFPNPFNPTTVIQYELPSDGHATLQVFDILGREVATLLNRHETAGYHEIIFDAGALASGPYFYRFVSGEFVATRRMMLIK